MANQSTTPNAPLINFGTIGKPTQPTNFKLTQGNMTVPLATPQNNGSTTPLLGTLANNPNANVSSKPTTLTPSQTLPNQPSSSSGSGIDYTWHPGESTDAYNARIAAARASQASPASSAQSPIQPTTQPAAQPNPTANTNPYTATPPGFGGLIGTLATAASQPSPAFTDAQIQAKAALDALTQSRTNEAQQLGLNYTNPIPLEFQQGRGQVLQSQYQQQQDALAQQYAGATAQMQAATGQQAAQQSGLGAAAGLAQPVQVPYSNQFINPATGQPVGGGGIGTLPPQAQSLVTSMAQQVQGGQMTYQQALSNLSAYGPAGISALTQALGPNFNVNASTASAGTTATGQQIQTAATSTNAALDTLSNSFANLPGFETGGIPATNNIANWIATQFGSQALQQYKTNLADARSQLIGVLNSSGGTPTGNEATANQYLPDNMTKAQFDANVGTAQNPGIVRQLISQKVSAFTGSGAQTTPTNNTQTGGAIVGGWASLGD